MIDFYRLGTPGLNQDHSSGSNSSMIRYQHHLWRDHFRESRETFQETFVHKFFCLVGLSPEGSVGKYFFQIISTFGRRLSQRDWLRYLSGTREDKLLLLLLLLFITCV